MLQSECGEKETFGANFNYKIKEFKISQESNVLNENTFVATVLVNVCDDQEIEKFLTEFKEISNTDYNKNKSYTKYNYTGWHCTGRTPRVVDINERLAVFFRPRIQGDHQRCWCWCAARS